MKKYLLLLLVGLFCFADFGEAQAKAVKLGRAAGGKNKVVHMFPDCSGSNCRKPDASTVCPDHCKNCGSDGKCLTCQNKYYLTSAGQCETCPPNGTCNGTTTISCLGGYKLSSNTCIKCDAGYYSGTGSNTCTKCGAGSYSSEAGSMSCVQCPTGYYASGTGNTTCTPCNTLNVDNGTVTSCSITGSVTAVACNSGYHKTSASATSCTSNCSGVSCASSLYTTVANETGCCCELNMANATVVAELNKDSLEPASICTSTQVYNSTIGKCVDAVCPANCSNCTSGFCKSCNSGYYLNYTSGMCTSCPTGCATCTGSSSGYTCNTCSSGYYKSGSSCSKCPQGCATCSSSSSCTTCKTGYTKSGSTCKREPLVLEENTLRGNCSCASDNTLCQCFQEMQLY